MRTRTTTQMIDALRNPADAAAWSGFDARYRPVLVAFARKLGFDPESAAELAQQTLVEFAKSYTAGKYQRGQGRLSSWLIGIARNVGAGLRRKRAVHVGGDTMIGKLVCELPDEHQMTSLWEKEREQAVLVEAMTQLRGSSNTEPNTIRPFELFALRGVPAAEVAAQCGISVDSVYVIKNRLTRRLREIVVDLTANFDEGD